MAAQVLGRRKLSPLLMKGTLCIMYSKPGKPFHLRTGTSWPQWDHGAIHEDISEKKTPGELRQWWKDSHLIEDLED